MASKWRTTAPTYNPIQYAQIDGLVILKILKHCQEEGSGSFEPVQGVLLGLVDSKKLEITNCFALPRQSDKNTSIEEYQMEMMRRVRQLNIDHFQVGWYQSTYLGMSVYRSLLDSQFTYQKTIQESVVILCDPLSTESGRLCVKAMRLSQQAMELYQSEDFSLESVKKLGLTHDKVFEEVPLVVKNSHLANILCLELEERLPADRRYGCLDLASNSVLEKNLSMLSVAVDDLNQEAYRYFNVQKQNSRQQQLKKAFLEKRAAENKIRAERGERPLPDEDVNKLYRSTPAPPRLDSLLVSGQIRSHAEQAESFVGQTLAKLHMAKSLHESDG